MPAKPIRSKKLAVQQVSRNAKKPPLNVVDMPTQFGSVKAALEVVNGFSAPSKMPGWGYSIPASACITGAKLALVEGSPCYICYANRGNYMFQNVRDSLAKRMASLSDPNWVDAMVYAIAHKCAEVPFFRWHDSGDLQSVDHLRQIVAVCRRTPTVRHWLPTREYAFVRAYLASGGVIPANLVIRLSAHMIDGAVPDKDGLPYSSVSTADAVYPEAFHCPARHQGNACQDCRACWSDAPEHRHVSYHKH